MPSPWRPLRHPLFRTLWIASLASQIGTWMHEVGAAWLMTAIASSALQVSLVQTAATLPLFALALPAGALADVLDRRRLLIASQLAALVVAACLAGATASGLVTPEVLLALTAALAAATAFSAPAWQAVLPELVPRPELPLAVALNGIAINLSRTVGPALGGLLVGLAGPAFAFAANALSFVGIVAVLVAWRRAPETTALPAERFAGALRGGLRYARHVEGFGGVLVRTAGFLLPASALWALLPVVARQELGLSALGYGGLLAAVGLGAIVGASRLPRWRRRVASRVLTPVAALGVAAPTAVLALAPSVWLAGPALALLGVGWIVVISSLHVGAQAVAAGWVRARVLSVFLLVFFGSLSLGSAFWGALADRVGAPGALATASLLLALGTVLARWFELPVGDAAPLAPSRHWPAPPSLDDLAADAGPVLVTVEYRVAPADQARFLERMQVLGRHRRRDGGFGWNVFRDSADPEAFTEVFYAASWTDHLRQHERVTVEDRALQDEIRSLQIGGEAPRVRHGLAGSGRGPAP